MDNRRDFRAILGDFIGTQHAAARTQQQRARARERERGLILVLARSLFARCPLAARSLFARCSLAVRSLLARCSLAARSLARSLARLAQLALLKSYSTLGPALQHARFVACFTVWGLEQDYLAPEVFQRNEHRVR
jgi:hypothetical protein